MRGGGTPIHTVVQLEVLFPECCATARVLQQLEWELSRSPDVYDKLEF